MTKNIVKNRSQIFPYHEKKIPSSPYILWLCRKLAKFCFSIVQMWKLDPLGQHIKHIQLQAAWTAVQVEHLYVLWMCVQLNEVRQRQTRRGHHYSYSYESAGYDYMVHADESGQVMQTEAGSRLLTSSTTKLSSLLSASLPCKRKRNKRQAEKTPHSCSVTCFMLMRTYRKTNSTGSKETTNNINVKADILLTRDVYWQKSGGTLRITNTKVRIRYIALPWED